jgi:hypothetical protein
MLHYFDPDFRCLGAGDASESIASVLYEAVQSILSKDGVPMHRHRFRHTRSSKMASMLRHLVAGNLALACPALNHFSNLSPTSLSACPTQAILGFHILLPALLRRLQCVGDMPITAIVHNVEWSVRQTRPSNRLRGLPLYLSELWNVRGLRKLDSMLSDIDLLFLSHADYLYFLDNNIQSKSKAYIGYCCLIPDTEIARCQLRLSDVTNYEPKLLFLANGHNKDNRAALHWLLEHTKNFDRTISIVLCGSGWDSFPENPAGSPVSLIRKGFVPELADILSPGTVGLNLDIFGAGVKSKMMDYMALGLPFVSTPEAVRGVSNTMQSLLEVHSSAEEFLRAAAGLQERKRWEEVREHLRDNLSNWASRRYFQNRLGEAIAQANIHLPS